MPSRVPKKRMKRAFDSDDLLCESCRLTVQEYALTLRGRDDGRPVPGTFVLPEAVAHRLPMCRSAMPLCEGMETLLTARFGGGTARAFMDEIVPLVPH